ARKDYNPRPTGLASGATPVVGGGRARTVNHPAPRRVKTRDTAKIKNNLPRLTAIRDQRISLRLNGRRGIHRPAPAKRERERAAEALFGKFWSVRQVHLARPNFARETFKASLLRGPD